MIGPHVWLFASALLIAGSFIRPRVALVYGGFVAGTHIGRGSLVEARDLPHEWVLFPPQVVLGIGLTVLLIAVTVAWVWKER